MQYSNRTFIIFIGIGCHFNVVYRFKNLPGLPERESRLILNFDTIHFWFHGRPFSPLIVQFGRCFFKSDFKCGSLGIKQIIWNRPISAPNILNKYKRVEKNAVTRIRTWVITATTWGTNHYTITAHFLAYEILNKNQKFDFFFKCSEKFFQVVRQKLFDQYEFRYDLRRC